MAENRKGTTILSRELTRSTIRGSFQFYAILHGSLYLVSMRGGATTRVPNK
jgi:hypothetical protein